MNFKSPPKNHSDTKGQTSSKWFFRAVVSSKKRMKEFYFTAMKPQVDLYLFVFGRNWRHQKNITKLTDLYWAPKGRTRHKKYFEWDIQAEKFKERHYYFVFASAFFSISFVLLTATFLQIYLVERSMINLTWIFI